jgi:hypothetical protein
VTSTHRLRWNEALKAKLDAGQTAIEPGRFCDDPYGMEASSDDHVVLRLKLCFDAVFAYAKRMSALQRVRPLFISDCN